MQGRSLERAGRCRVVLLASHATGLSSGEPKMSSATNPAKESLRQEQAEQRKKAKSGNQDSELTEALKDTFPASDPVAAQTPVTAGDDKTVKKG